MIGTWISVSRLYNMESNRVVGGMGWGGGGQGGEVTKGNRKMRASENVKSDLIQTLTYRDTIL